MGRTLRVALADDDAGVRNCLRLWLTELGHEVTAVGDGAALVELCRTQFPDLVISDVRMPGMDGIEAAHAIRRAGATPLILISGSWDDDQAERADATGAVRLLKPPRPLALVAAIDKACPAAGRAAPRACRNGHAAPAPGGDLLRQFVETVEDYAILTLDPAGDVTTWNRGAERLLGYAGGEVVGRSWNRIFTPEDLAAGTPARDLKAAADAGRADEERWYLRKDGTRVWGLGALTALRGPDGRLLGYGKIVRDRTELKAREDAVRARAAALEESDARRAAFIATLGHEIRNPLSPLLNYAGLLRMRDDPDVRTVGDKIDRQVRQIARLVDDLMDVSRVCQGKARLDRRRVDLGGVVAQAADAVRPRIEEGRHKLTVAVPDAPVWLDADPDRLNQVVVNLLVNASKYTPPKGRIAATVEAADGQAVLRVCDDGAGIPADRLASVFDLFAQDARTLSQAQGGLGIGLALVKELVTLHDGTVQALSEGEDRGSEFVVRLPRAADCR